MSDIKQTKRPVSMWTDHNQKEYAFFITRGQAIYGIKYVSYMRGFLPANFDYRKKFREEADKLDCSGDGSAKFSILGSSPEAAKLEDGKIKIRFLMPGPIRQEFNIELDPQKQDIEGEIALKVDCVIKRVSDVRIPAFYYTALDRIKNQD